MPLIDILLVDITFGLTAGFIQRADIVNIPEFVMNPLSERILAVLDPQNKDQINFFEFAKRLSVFSKRAPVEDKVRSSHLHYLSFVELKLTC